MRYSLLVLSVAQSSSFLPLKSITRNVILTLLCKDQLMNQGHVLVERRNNDDSRRRSFSHTLAYLRN
uniref:Putative secreted protein n=1 Tax=Anopheles darlingi TaxID=43151 RepID=A0A2M4DMJ5_ANODA